MKSREWSKLRPNSVCRADLSTFLGIMTGNPMGATISKNIDKIIENTIFVRLKLLEINKYENHTNEIR